MDIVIIGSGNVATVLGRKMKMAGHTILQVAARNVAGSSSLADELDAEHSRFPGNINQNGDVYIISVSDDAIAEVAAGLKLPGKVVAHTAASVSKDVLKNASNHYGVFYPLQSLHKEDKTLPEIPIFFDGSDEMTKRKLEALANSISPDHVAEAGDDKRLKLHLAAVFVNNFTNHLYALAGDYCFREGIEFKELFPLIEETVSRMQDISPSESQTGPAVRRDTETIGKHLALLQNYPHLKIVYEALTTSIGNFKTK